MYSPKIKPEYVRALYRIKHSLPKPIPITKLANTAIKEFLQNHGGEIEKYRSQSDYKSSQLYNKAAQEILSD